MRILPSLSLTYLVHLEAQTFLLTFAAYEHKREVRPSDIDSLNHVNNAKYVYYFEDAKEYARRDPHFHSTFPMVDLSSFILDFYVEYNAAAVFGDVLSVFLWPESRNAVCFEIVREDGTSVTKARARIAEISRL
jgi:YbgC/YbaW family acyl-CoA thioester hydrolase